MVLNSTLLKHPNGVELSNSHLLEKREKIVVVDFSERNNAPRSRFDELTKKRLLTEVKHLEHALADNLVFDEQVEEDVLQNIETMAQEIGMPNAITVTEHDVDHIDLEGRRKRIFRWLGKTAVEHAESGIDYYATSAGLKRMAVEIEEAEYAQDKLKQGDVHVFISPKMSVGDGTVEDAKRDHVAHDDALRISYLSEDGQKRIIQSMLIRDIPLDAWVSMLNDSGNIFGKSVEVEDEKSALAVMKVFRELTVTKDALPSGVLSIAEAVIPYIPNHKQRKVVSSELLKYRDQEEMKRDAKRQASEWLNFNKELALSLKTGYATSAIKQFIYTNQSNWCDADLGVLRHYQTESGEFRMCDDIAAICENANKRIREIEISAVHDTERVTQQIGASLTVEIKKQQQDATKVFYADKAEYMQFLQQQAAQSTILGLQYESADRGCSGGSKEKNTLQSLFDISEELTKAVFTDGDTESDKESSKDEWKTGVCRIESCDSRQRDPGTTKVGPCSICKKCEDKFNAGQDPTKESVVSIQPTQQEKTAGILGFISIKKEKQRYAA